MMQAAKLPLTIWFQAFCLFGQAKSGISSLELSRHLNVNCDTALLLAQQHSQGHERAGGGLRQGEIQMDDADLDRERLGGKEVGDRRTRSRSLLPFP